LLILAMACISK